jgi:hypothetical protein
MELTSICGLGMVAGNPLVSVFRSFRQDVAPYLRVPQLRTISDLAALRSMMTDISGLAGLKAKTPTAHETMSDFEILGEPGHE